MNKFHFSNRLFGLLALYGYLFFLPPSVSNAQTCSITAVSATPSACNIATNTYSLSFIVSYQNPAAGRIIVTTTQGASVSFTPDGTSPDVVTIQGLVSDNVKNIDVTARFEDVPSCSKTQINAYDAPVSCATTCSGTFLDSGGSSGNYSNNENYIVSYCTGLSGQKIRFNFSAFSLGSGDYLEIYDGTSINAPLIGRYSTSALGTIISSYDCLTFHFVSDGNTVGSGWNATIDCTVSSVVNTSCDEFAIVGANYGNSTMTRYDGATGAYLNTLATSAQGLSAPNAMFQLPSGVILVSNGSAGNVVKIDPYTGASLGVFATGLNFPEQIKVAPDGFLYLANQNANNIKKYDTNGTLLATITNANIIAPQGIGFTDNGKMFISNNQNGGQINRYTPAGVWEALLFDYPTGETPRGIAMLGNDLYVNVVYSGGARVDKFTNATGSRATFLTMDGGSNPFAGIVWGPDGRLYISDYGESEMQIYNANGSVYRTITSTLNGVHGVAFAGCTVLNILPLTSKPLCNAADGSISAIVSGGVAPYTYAWSTGATTPSVSGLVQGTYSLTITDWNGVKLIETVVLDCICPTLSSPSAAQSLCEGGPGSNLTVQTNYNTVSGVRFVRFTTDQMASSSPTASEASAIYGGTTIGTAATPTGANSPYTATYSYNSSDFPNVGTTPITYYVYAILNPDGGATCRPVQEIQITINPQITISTQPIAITECVGGTQTVSVATTSSVVTYQWQSSPTLLGTYLSISGATAATYLPVSTATGTLYYRVIVSSSSTGCTPVTSNAVAVTIVSDPSVSIATTTPTICTGANITLNATQAGGAGSCTIQWQSSPDGNTWSPISGATANAYSPTNLSTTIRYRAQISCTGSGCCN